jgi:PAS domain S-box-containing protein
VGQNGDVSESSIWFHIFLDASPQPAAFYSEKGEPLSLNKAFTQCFGWSVQDLSLDISPFIPASEKNVSKDHLVNSLAGKASLPLQTRRLKKDGGSREVVWHVSWCRGTDGRPLGRLETYCDYDEERSGETRLETLLKSEQALRESLREKEILLQEIHHRVKNNMQVIASMLGIQKMQITDPLAKRVFSQSQDRIRAMAMVHESVYQSGSFNHIQFDEYVRTLCSAIYRSYCESPHKVKMLVQVQPASIGLNEAVPLGLVLNELVTNAFKHAFPPGAEGEVRIEGRLLPSADLELIVSDNGVGFPPDLEVADASGLYMVRGLVEQQLKGSINMDALKNGQGAKVEVCFKTGVDNR